MAAAPVGAPERGAIPPPEIASIRRRLASMLYESLLLAAVVAVTVLAPHVLAGVLFHMSAPGWLVLLHLVAVAGLYFVWFWLRNGQTLAMHTWRIRLVDARDGRLTPARAVGRYLLAWPSILFYGAGLIWALLDRDRQFLHDRLAGTRIVYLGRPSRP